MVTGTLRSKMFGKIKKIFENGKESDITQNGGLSQVDSLRQQLKAMFESLAKDYNSSVAEDPLQIIVREVLRQAELDHNRLLVHSGLWALSIRTSSSLIECFIMPSTELPNLLDGETPSRLKLRLTLSDGNSAVDAAGTWLMDGLSVNEEELHTLMCSLLKDVVTRSQGDYNSMPENVRLAYGGISLTRSVRGLVADKHMLVQKIVDQQEKILAGVARDLHDAVLGNVLLLERALAGSDSLTQDEMLAIIEEISTRLREISHDLYPRDLKDCGLRPLLEQLCHDFKRRTKCDITFDIQGETPDFTDEVLLHIYRIAQECFNNIAKHSGASNVSFKIEVESGKWLMIIADDGEGIIESGACTSGGGAGLNILRERTELIDCIYPARISLETQPGKGTRLMLEIIYKV